MFDRQKKKDLKSWKLLFMASLSCVRVLSDVHAVFYSHHIVRVHKYTWVLLVLWLIVVEDNKKGRRSCLCRSEVRMRFMTTTTTCNDNERLLTIFFVLLIWLRLLLCMYIEYSYLFALWNAHIHTDFFL